MSRQSRTRGRTIALVAAIALALVPGCLVSPRTMNSVGQVATAALWTAAVAGQIALLTYHDAHYHHDHCGHYRRWHGARWVYYYGGHWEYYDDRGNWYYYAD